MWSNEENEAVNKAFRFHILQKTVPLHNDLVKAIEKFPILKHRGSVKLKNKVRNLIKGAQSR